MDITNQIEGDNLTVEVVKASPSKKLVLLSAGENIVTPEGTTKAKFQVEIDGKQMKWIPNKSTKKNLAQALGVDTLKWVGKLIGLEITNMKGKDCIIGKVASL